MISSDGDRVIFIELLRSKVEPLIGFERSTELLCRQHGFKSNVILGFLAPGMKKGDGVGGVFNRVPRDELGWTIELGLELTSSLPQLDGKSECVVTIDGDQDSRIDIFMSNRMSRFNCVGKEGPFHVLAPRTKDWHGTAEVRQDDNVPLMAVEEQLHTFAALKAWIDGPSAEAAFESSVKRILGNLAGGINKILLASRESCQSLLPLERRIAVDTIPFVYVLIIGKDGAREGARLVVDLRRASLLAEDLVGDRASRFRSIANGSEIVDDVDRLLGEARSSLLDGELEFSFLQCVIAAEMATTRFVRNECIRRGISKKKLDDLKREMTYSWALNVGLHLCMDPPQAIDAGLVSRMNQARSVRNELMHEASFEMTAGDVRQLVEDTKQYLEVLRRFARRSVEAT